MIRRPRREASKRAMSLLEHSGEEDEERAPQHRRRKMGEEGTWQSSSSSEDDAQTTDESEAEETPSPRRSGGSERTPHAPRKWLESEDEKLLKAVAAMGEANWKSIARIVGTRSHVQCLQRYKKVLRPGLKKGLWSPEEDAKLMELVAEGFRNWGQLAQHLEGRTSKQCRERWCHHLDPSIKKTRYTDEEDRAIIALQHRFGNRWSAIATELPGRTENAIKIRWKTIQRRAGGRAGGSKATDGGEGGSRKRGSAASASAGGAAPRGGPRTTAKYEDIDDAAFGGAAAGGGGAAGGSSSGRAFPTVSSGGKQKGLGLSRLHAYAPTFDAAPPKASRRVKPELSRADELVSSSAGIEAVAAVSAPAEGVAAAAAPVVHWCDGSLLMPLFEGAAACEQQAQLQLPGRREAATATRRPLPLPLAAHQSTCLHEQDRYQQKQERRRQREEEERQEAEAKQRLEAEPDAWRLERQQQQHRRQQQQQQQLQYLLQQQRQQLSQQQQVQLQQQLPQQQRRPQQHMPKAGAAMDVAWQTPALVDCPRPAPAPAAMTLSPAPLPALYRRGIPPSASVESFGMLAGDDRLDPLLLEALDIVGEMDAPTW